jgi:hypothetical protein
MAAMAKVARAAPNPHSQCLQDVTRIALEIETIRVSPLSCSTFLLRYLRNAKCSQGTKSGKVQDTFGGLVIDVACHVVYTISSTHKATAGMSAELSKYLQKLVQCAHIIIGHGFKC